MISKSKELRYIHAAAFSNIGLLQEVNRGFFHPHGLCLGVDPNQGVRQDDAFLVQVEDHRGDPEGVVFAAGVIDKSKVHRVSVLLESKRDARAKLLDGHIIQQLEGDPEAEDEDHGVIRFTIENEEVLVVDSEGIIYKGERMKDAGEAHKSLMSVLNSML